MTFKIPWDDIGELMRVSTVVIGIIAGMGFIFIGFSRTHVAISLLGFSSLFMGLIVTPTLRKEEDEYKIKPVPQPTPPTQPTQPTQPTPPQKHTTPKPTLDIPNKNAPKNSQKPI